MTEESKAKEPYSNNNHLIEHRIEQNEELRTLEERARQYKLRAQRLYSQGKRIAADELLKKRAKLMKRIADLRAILRRMYETS